MEAEFVAFISAIRQFFEDLDNTHINSFLVDWPTVKCRTRSIAPLVLPVLYWMPQVVAAAHQKAAFLVKMLASMANQITWGQTYSAEDFGSGFLEKYGWTELIGLRGPIASERMACGFLLLGPEIEYPRHSHEAEEVYVPLTEPTYWMRGNEDWELRAACRPIFHASRMPHAMRTESVPLLALYLWHGGSLIEKSSIH